MTKAPARTVDITPPVIVSEVEIPAGLLTCPSRSELYVPAPAQGGLYKMSDIDILIADLFAGWSVCEINLAMVKDIYSKAQPDE